jgi:hypothetical protein
MKKTKRIVSVIFLFVGLVLLLADNSYFVFSNILTFTISTIGHDVSDHFEQTHSHGHEDNVVLNDNNSKKVGYQLIIGYITLTDSNISKQFISKIWQPPKLV